MTSRHPFTAVVLVSLASALLAACGKDAPLAPPGTASAASSVAEPPSPAATAKPIAVDVALVPLRFELAKLGFDGLADLKPHLHAWDVGGVFQQGVYLRGDNERFEILVRAHGDETIAGFERDHSGYTLSRQPALQICGRSAVLVRATHAEQHIACVMVEAPGQNHPAYVPPIEATAVAFEHDNLGVVMTVEVEAADPAVYRPLVDRIIASIRCF